MKANTLCCFTSIALHLSHCFSSPLLRAPSRRPRACPARVDGLAAPAAPPVAQRQVKSSRSTFRRQQLQIISRDMWLYLGCNAPRRSNVTASESVVNQTSIQPPPQHGEDGAHICSLSKRNKIAVYTLIIVAFLIIAHVLLFLTTSCAPPRRFRPRLLLQFCPVFVPLLLASVAVVTSAPAITRATRVPSFPSSPLLHNRRGLPRPAKVRQY